MKKTLLTTAVMVASVGALAQGTVNFANTPSAIGGTQGQIMDASGAPIAGDAGKVQLFMGADASSMTAQGAAISFIAGAGAGYFNGGSVSVEGVAPGAEGTAVVRAWDSDGGDSWQAALDAGVDTGQSAVFQQATGGAGSPPSLPANMVNMTGFSLVPIPEPSTAALGILGAVALMLRRRK